MDKPVVSDPNKKKQDNATISIDRGQGKKRTTVTLTETNKKSNDDNDNDKENAAFKKNDIFDAISKNESSNPIATAAFERSVYEPSFDDNLIDVGPTLLDVLLENKLDASKDTFQRNNVYNADDMGAVLVVSEILGVEKLKQYARSANNATNIPAFYLFFSKSIDDLITNTTDMLNDATRRDPPSSSSSLPFDFFKTTDLFDLGMCASTFKNRFANAPRFVNAFAYPNVDHRLGCFGNDRDQLYCKMKTPAWTCLFDDKQQFAVTGCYDVSSALFDQLSKLLKTENANPFMLFTFLSYIGMFDASRSDDPHAIETETNRKKPSEDDEESSEIPNGSFLIDFSDESFAKTMVDKYMDVKTSEKTFGSDITVSDVHRMLSLKLKLTAYLMTLYELKTSSALLEECLEALKQNIETYETHVFETTNVARNNESDNHAYESESFSALPNASLITSPLLSTMGVRYVGTVVEAIEDAQILSLFFGFRREIEKAYRFYVTNVEKKLFDDCEWLKRMNVDETNVNDACENVVKRFRNGEKNRDMIAFFQELCKIHIKPGKDQHVDDSFDYLYKTYAHTLKSLYDLYATEASDAILIDTMTRYESKKPFESSESEFETANETHGDLVGLIYVQIQNVSNQMKKDMEEDSKKFHRFKNMLNQIALSRAVYERVYVSRLADFVGAVSVLKHRAHVSNMFERCRSTKAFMERYYKPFYESVLSKSETPDQKTSTRLCKTSNLYPQLMFPCLNDSLFYVTQQHPSIFDSEQTRRVWVFTDKERKQDEDYDTFDPIMSSFRYDRALTSVNHAPFMPFIDVESDGRIARLPSSYATVIKHVVKPEKMKKACKDVRLFEKQHILTPFQSVKPYQNILRSQELRTKQIDLNDASSFERLSHHDDHYFSIFVNRCFIENQIEIAKLYQKTQITTQMTKPFDADYEKYEKFKMEKRDVCLKTTELCQSIDDTYSKAFKLFDVVLQNDLKGDDLLLSLYGNAIFKFWIALRKKSKDDYDDDDDEDEKEEEKDDNKTQIIEKKIQKALSTLKTIVTKKYKNEKEYLTIAMLSSGFCAFKLNLFRFLFFLEKAQFESMIKESVDQNEMTESNAMQYLTWLSEYDLNVNFFLNFVINRQSIPDNRSLVDALNGVSENVSSFDDWEKNDYNLPYMGSEFNRFLSEESYLYIFLTDMLNIYSVKPFHQKEVVHLENTLNKLQLYYVSKLRRNGGLIPYNKVKTHHKEFITSFDRYVMQMSKKEEEDDVKD